MQFFFREIISLCRIGISDFDQIKKLGGENQQLKYSRKQLAIIKLKLIIYFMENTKNNHYLLPYEINNFIDSQIKELKEGK